MNGSSAAPEAARAGAPRAAAEGAGDQGPALPASAAGDVVLVGPRLAIAGPLTRAAALMLAEAVAKNKKEVIRPRRGVPRDMIERAKELYNHLHPLPYKGVEIWILIYPGYYGDLRDIEQYAKIKIVRGYKINKINNNMVTIKTTRCYSSRIGCFSRTILIIYDKENDGYYLYEVTREPKSENDVMAILGGPRVAAALKKGLEVRRQGDVYFIRRDKCRGARVAREATIFGSHNIIGEIYYEEKRSKRIYVKDGVATHPQHPEVQLDGCWEVTWNTRRVTAIIETVGGRLGVYGGSFD